MEMSSPCQKRTIIKSSQFSLPYTITLGLIVGVFVGSTAGYLGSIMVSRHMALVGDALSHVALPGLALGILFNFNPFIGAFAFLAATVIVTWYLQKSTTLSVEAIIGVLFVLALAIGILITPRVDLLEALFGDVSKITLTDTIITVLVSVCVIFITRTIYEKLAVSMISKELAVASRIKVERINLILSLPRRHNSCSRNKRGWNAASRSRGDSSCSCSQEYQLYALSLFPHECYLRAGQCNIGGHLIKLRECPSRAACRNRGRGYFCCRCCGKLTIEKTRPKEFPQHKYVNLNMSIEGMYNLCMSFPRKNILLLIIRTRPLSSILFSGLSALIYCFAFSRLVNCCTSRHG